MTRANNGGWDFVEVGGVYQYKEEHLILIVEIMSDNSTEDMYVFDVKPIAGTEDFKKDFTVSFVKNLSGTFNGASQFYKDPEYMLLPIGTKWPFVFHKDVLKTKGIRFTWEGMQS